MITNLAFWLFMGAIGVVLGLLASRLIIERLSKRQVKCELPQGDGAISRASVVLEQARMTRLRSEQLERDLIGSAHV